MAKRLLIIISATIVLFYVYSGYHFYKKSFSKNTTLLQNEDVVEIDTTKLVVIKEDAFDFESGNFNITDEAAYSGKRSLKIIPKKEFDSEYLMNFSSLPHFNYFREVEINLMGYKKKKMKNPVLWVVEIISDSGKVLSWESSGVMPVSDKWENFHFRIKLKPELLLSENILKIYVWNKNKESLFADELKISLWGYSTKIKN